MHTPNVFLRWGRSWGSSDFEFYAKDVIRVETN